MIGSSFTRYCSTGTISYDPLVNDCEWDVFISAYNDSDRVKTTFTNSKATRKIWWILPEYGYDSTEVPSDEEVMFLNDHDEDTLVINGIDGIGKDALREAKVCIDITGFMRPHLLFLMRYLPTIGVNTYDMLYTEPTHYSLKSDTEFTSSSVKSVRTVAGYAGQHDTDLSNDHVIVGVGYDHELIARVVSTKESAKFVQLHSFPSLSADMYHESLIRLNKVDNAMPRVDQDVFFSSANDPFVTAAALSDAVTKLYSNKPITNLYLSPLATKVQAIGFGLFYLKEKLPCPVSMIFPFSSNYNRKTSSGIGRSWLYKISI